MQGSCPQKEQKQRTTQAKSDSPGEQLEDTLKDLPDKVRKEVTKELGGVGDCKNAARPKKCRKKDKDDPGQTLDRLLDDLEDEVKELPDPLDTGTGGLP